MKPCRMEPVWWLASLSPIQTSSTTTTVSTSMRSHPRRRSIKEMMRRLSFRLNRFTKLIRHGVKVHASITAITTWSNGKLCWCHLLPCWMRAPEEPRRSPVGIFFMNSTASLASPTAPAAAVGAWDAWAAAVLIPWLTLAPMLWIGIESPRALSGLEICKY